MNTTRILDCRFATRAEAESEAFERVGRECAALNARHDLPDHTALNRAHYPWADGRFPGPQMYGSRHWEYPFAILAAELKPGMACADIGCGRTPFTAYLASRPDVRVAGFDPDLFLERESPTAFGVSEDYIRSTGIEFHNSGMTQLDAPDNQFDRVFCLSVIEHLEADTARKGMREMARVLKPGGRLILTVDLMIHDTLCEVDPLSLIWESGLVPAAGMNLRWPRHRLGIGYKGDHPADVFGMVLEKPDGTIDGLYAHRDAPPPPQIIASTLPGMRAPAHHDSEPIPWPRRLRMALDFILHGNRRNTNQGRGLS